MSKKTKYNPERRVWRGKSYKKSNMTLVRVLRIKAADVADRIQVENPQSL